jgi:hypothetical protein
MVPDVPALFGIGTAPSHLRPRPPTAQFTPVFKVTADAVAAVAQLLLSRGETG